LGFVIVRRFSRESMLEKEHHRRRKPPGIAQVKGTAGSSDTLESSVPETLTEGGNVGIPGPHETLSGSETEG
jgi:hypothetical protein